MGTSVSPCLHLRGNGFLPGARPDAARGLTESEDSHDAACGGGGVRQLRRAGARAGAGAEAGAGAAQELCVLHAVGHTSLTNTRDELRV
jgi:hypothetical protein